MRSLALQLVEARHLRKDIVDFRPGDTVRVWWKITEGEKERSQAFEGIVIRKTRGTTDATFTVRKVSFSVGVERIFPLHSPRWEQIEVVSRGDVRRNRLFYLRGLRGKAARVSVQDDHFTGVDAPAPTETAKPEAAPVDAKS